MEKVFIDTNILIYATLEGDRRFKKSNELLTGQGNEQGMLFVSVQNLAEMYPNLTGPKMSIPDTPALARSKILSIAALPTLTVLPITLEIQREALTLCERYGVLKQRYFDMQIVAAMLSYEIYTLFTENTANFEEISEITTINPF
jgi:predicted nucleic acid-binding protein